MLVLPGCTRLSVPPETVIVEVPGPVRYRALPEELTQSCIITLQERAAGEKPNAELLEEWGALQAALAKCETRIILIREQQGQPVTDLADEKRRPMPALVETTPHERGTKR